jgi:hypothetical protein
MPSTETFLQSLKDNDTQSIIMHLTFQYDKATLSDKINILIANVCVLKPKTIEIIIPLFNIKYNYGSPLPLYIKSVECSPDVFGFINTYYNPDKRTRLAAYTRAAYLDNIENMKKIKGISASKLGDFREYLRKNDGKVSETVKNYVSLNYKTKKAQKDTSPADFLQNKQKSKTERKIKSNYMKNALKL